MENTNIHWNKDFKTFSKKCIEVPVQTPAAAKC